LSQASHDAPQAAPPAEAATSDMPSFTIAIGAGTGDVHGLVSPSGTGEAQEADGAIVPEASVDAPARLVRGLAPAYPEAAHSEGIQGDVLLELIVGTSGEVESARVVRGVGHGLDEAAVHAMRQFRFAPAIQGGHAVRVRMGWSMQFRLQE
jgi:protein TonB